MIMEQSLLMTPVISLFFGLDNSEVQALEALLIV
jgi:predicted transcriptional regulator